MDLNFLDVDCTYYDVFKLVIVAVQGLPEVEVIHILMKVLKTFSTEPICFHFNLANTMTMNVYCTGSTPSKSRLKHS